MNLIDNANDIDQMVRMGNYTDVTNKELKKIEMYCRKTYLMLRHAEKLAEQDHSEDTFMTDLNAALIRDQRYVKVRDNMDDYDING
jgi:uncharacterized protein (DUF924 family)